LAGAVFPVRNPGVVTELDFEVTAVEGHGQLGAAAAAVARGAAESLLEEEVKVLAVGHRQADAQRRTPCPWSCPGFVDT
jgi:hypothetical protein